MQKEPDIVDKTFENVFGLIGFVGTTVISVYIVYYVTRALEAQSHTGAPTIPPV